jgi:hypothetical protein
LVSGKPYSENLVDWGYPKMVLDPRYWGILLLRENSNYGKILGYVEILTSMMKPYLVYEKDTVLFLICITDFSTGHISAHKQYTP